MQNCTGGRVQHPATHEETATMEDNDGIYELKQMVCSEHFNTTRSFDSIGAECIRVKRRKL